MDIRYIVQEGIWSPRDKSYFYRDVAEIMNDRAQAVEIAEQYPASRVLQCKIYFERKPSNPGGQYWENAQ